MNPPIAGAGSPTAGATSTTAVAPTAALRRWILGFCIIRFDLNQGQLIEELYPPNSFSSDHQLLIAFSSFPDSMHQSNPSSSSIIDSIFTFRFPSSNPASSFIYGYVFNRQRHDLRLPRGGEQRSVVILSHSPFSSAFRPLLQILGPLCFDLGHRTALDLVASYISSWPPPSSGSSIDLPIASASLKISIPSVPLSDSPLFPVFRGLLLHLWMLWELMLVGEPILVVAQNPTLCSDAVCALITLVCPLTVAVDFRPYFTIHDPDFQRLNSIPKAQAFPPMVLGVTNLFFLKAFSGIPHVVAVGGGKASTGANAGTTAGAGAGEKRFSPVRFLNGVKMRREGPLSLMTQHREAIWSGYAATTKPDTAVLNRLVDAGVSQRIEESMSVVNNDILRRHFVELTTNFLAPFGPYLRGSAPPSEGLLVFGEPPPLADFRVDEFLAGLAARGPGKFLAKRMRSNWLDLYRRFIEGKNFMPWFRSRRAAAEQEQRKLYRQARINTDIQKHIPKMSEVEIVDSFNAIERHLLQEIQQSGCGNAESVSACHKLKGDLQALFNVLPKDMQQLLLFNPKRAALIQGNKTGSDLPTTPKLPGHPVLSESPRTPTTTP